MGIFQQKSEAEKEQERQAKEAERAARERERLEREEQRRIDEEGQRRVQEEREARARYLASPVGMAQTAYDAGRMFFQFTTDISRIEGQASAWNGDQSTTVRHVHAVDVLGQIEEVGWRLENVGYVFVETGEVAREKAFSTGIVTRTQGYVEGIYLFRRQG